MYLYTQRLNSRQRATLPHEQPFPFSFAFFLLFLYASYRPIKHKTAKPGTQDNEEILQSEKMNDKNKNKIFGIDDAGKRKKKSFRQTTKDRGWLKIARSL